ncbi:MAG: hypothetical protein OFPI_28690 [Osedax symbiont Rs2]|nr:MAG: hypothetical protein OFPI_28690 [Osedax symbiont Rs2]
MTACNRGESRAVIFAQQSYFFSAATKTLLLLLKLRYIIYKTGILYV